jgi:hypothetical protein
MYYDAVVFTVQITICIQGGPEKKSKSFQRRFKNLRCALLRELRECDNFTGKKTPGV